MFLDKRSAEWLGKQGSSLRWGGDTTGSQVGKGLERFHQNEIIWVGGGAQQSQPLKLHPYEQGEKIILGFFEGGLLGEQ